MKFDHTSFWVSINNAPVACMAEIFVREWGVLIGKVEDVRIANCVMKYERSPKFCCPLKDFVDDDALPLPLGHFGSWMCAPSSPRRDCRPVRKVATNRDCDDALIMNMREIGKILDAVEQSRTRLMRLPCTPFFMYPPS
uniref:DUF4283 domain-containing protein n=1 Tax=Cannabis sativa TaxID=3483 RepID=A0A803P4S8_CANSA